MSDKRKYAPVINFIATLAFLASWGVFLPHAAEAAEPDPLSLTEAYEQALANNHDIRIAAEDVEQGRLLKRQAITVLFPRLTATGGWSRLEYEDGTETKGTVWGLSLNQTVYNGGRVWVAKRGAEYTLLSAQYGLEFARQSVLMDLVTRANQVLSAEDLLKVSEKRVERVKEQLRQAQTRLDLGDVPRTSVLAAQVTLSSVQLEEVEAKKEVILARTRLANLIGSDRHVRVMIPGEITMPADMSLERLIDEAMENRPDLSQGSELIRIAEQEAELTSRSGHPDVDITGSYTKYSEENPFAPESQIGINLTWPFFQGGLVKLQTREAYSRVRQAEEAYGSQADRIRLDVEEALLSLETLDAQTQLVVDNLETARENHRLALTRFRLGGATSLEVLDAEEDLAEAENLEVNHKYDTRTARAALLYSIGILKLDALQ